MPSAQNVAQTLLLQGKKICQNVRWELMHSMPWVLQTQHFVTLPVDIDRKQI
jgi:hypothetical protein